MYWHFCRLCINCFGGFKKELFNLLVLTCERMFFSVVISWETPYICGIWAAVSVILNSLGIQGTHRRMEICSVFRLVITTTTLHAKATRR